MSVAEVAGWEVRAISKAVALELFHGATRFAADATQLFELFIRQRAAGRCVQLRLARSRAAELEPHVRARGSFEFRAIDQHRSVTIDGFAQIVAAYIRSTSCL